MITIEEFGEFIRRRINMVDNVANIAQINNTTIREVEGGKEFIEEIFKILGTIPEYKYISDYELEIQKLQNLIDGFLSKSGLKW